MLDGRTAASTPLADPFTLKNRMFARSAHGIRWAYAQTKPKQV